MSNGTGISRFLLKLQKIHCTEFNLAIQDMVIFEGELSVGMYDIII
jgi:hypothetical protein